LPTSTEAPRIARRAASVTAAALAVACAALLSGCSEAEVTHQPATTATPFVISTLPPIGYNHRYGNNPVAAADAFALERKLYAQKQYWEVGLRTDPAQAGYVLETDPNATSTARAKATDMLVIIASESLPTLRSLVALGDAGQKTYCAALVDQIRALGYTGITKVDMSIYFGESDRHATLTWTTAGGYSFQILDNNLNGALLTPIPTATPFTTPPPH
jgi:hypothetical protein